MRSKMCSFERRGLSKCRLRRADNTNDKEQEHVLGSRKFQKLSLAAAVKLVVPDKNTTIEKAILTSDF